VLTKNLIVSKFATDTERIPPWASAHNAVLSGELLQIQSATPQVEGPEHMDPLSNVIALTTYFLTFVFSWFDWLCLTQQSQQRCRRVFQISTNGYHYREQRLKKTSVVFKISLVLDMKQRFLKGRE